MAELFKFFWFFGSLGGWKSIHQNFKCQLLKASRCSRTFDEIYVIDNCVLFHISCGLKCYLISASSMQGFLLFALIEWMDFHLGWMDFHLVCLVWMDFHPGWMDFQTSGRSSIKMDGFPSGVDGFPYIKRTSTQIDWYIFKKKIRFIFYFFMERTWSVHSVFLVHISVLEVI